MRVMSGILGLVRANLCAVAAAIVAFTLASGIITATRAAAEDAGQPPTLVIVNAILWTGTPLTGAESPQNGPRDSGRADVGHADEPTAIAVIGDTIAAVGETETIRQMVGPKTKVIDAGGRRVIPGITDSHTHMVSGGFQLAGLALREVRSREEFIRAVAEDAKSRKPGQWVLGGRWSVESWDDPKPPDKSWLDSVTRGVPVYLTRMDGHQALVNSAALGLADVDANGPDDPKGGEIVRDPKTGEPTGILKESAMELVSRLIPARSSRDRHNALLGAMRHANSLGITSVHDMSALEDITAFHKADADGRLTVRITSYLSVSDWPAYIDDVHKWQQSESTMFRVAGFKGFMDGSLGSRTAYMREPFSDVAPKTRYPRGQLTAMADPPESFRKLVATADRRGLQLAVHAIGDEANHLLLDAYEAAAKQNSPRDSRHRIEHAQHLHVEDIPRFSKLGVVASMQPFHKADDGRYAEKAIGNERLKGSYAFRQLVDTGALLCLGSDWPVVTLNPFAGIDAAVSAKTLAGNVWLKAHSLTLEEALLAYTAAPARAIHREDRLGTIEVGKLADLVILADDPFTIPVERIGDVKVSLTILGGKVVFDRADYKTFMATFALPNDPE